MKCPRCGHEMVMDSHRKIEMYMCYDCGYIQGRNTDSAVAAPVSSRPSNFEHMANMNLNEAAAFISRGISMDEEKLAAWLESPAEVVE